MIRRIGKTVVCVAPIVGFCFVGNVSADVPAAVGTAITGIQTDALALIDLVWPAVAAIVGGFVLFKIFKRGASKV